MSTKSDTSPAIQQKMLAMMKRKSGEERLKMGASMFDMARSQAIASFQDKNTDDINVKLFLRFYGRDFQPERCKKIVSYLSKCQTIRQI